MIGSRYFVTKLSHISFAVLDENSTTVGHFPVEQDALEAAAGMNLISRLATEFPGWLDDEPVNGGDLVDAVNTEIEFYPADSDGTIRARPRTT